MFEQIKKLYKNKELIFSLAIQDLKLKYAASYLGIFWSLLEPFLVILVYSLVFPLILQAEFLNWVSFFIAGLIPFRFLEKGITDVTRSMSEKADILSKVKMLPEIVPISKCISDFVNFTIESIVFLTLTILFVKPTIYIFIYPILMIIEFLVVLGIGLFLTYHFPKMRDLDYILRIAFMLLFFLTPIVYRTNRLPKNYRSIHTLNPFAILIYLYQGSVLYSLTAFKEILLLLPNLIMMFLFSIIVFFVGYKLFNKHKYEALEKIT